MEDELHDKLDVIFSKREPSQMASDKLQLTLQNCSLHVKADTVTLPGTDSIKP